MSVRIGWAIVRYLQLVFSLLFFYLSPYAILVRIKLGEPVFRIFGGNRFAFFGHFFDLSNYMLLFHLPGLLGTVWFSCVYVRSCT